ncbi:glycosyltransferase family 4 protein [Williamsia sp.]|uniref:glycosyltransferase family 4 protein n=1 Tax=Williamsia sp. TaxID=1872085 RepID=UPI002F926142
MRILVHPHLMEIGGSQLNALELADAVGKAGHDVTVYAPAGELDSVASSMAFDRVVAPPSGTWASVRNIRKLSQVAGSKEFDVVHAYEWGPSIDFTLGPHRATSVPMVTTILSMDVPDFLVRHEPLIVGTAELLAEQAPTRARTFLLEPPINTDINTPCADNSGARRQFGLVPTDIVIAVICRLSTDLDKVVGVLQAIRVVDRLAEHSAVRLLVIGDGHGLTAVTTAAAEVNLRHDRDVIIVAGGMTDPRPGYEAADIVIGMGSSALKGMAFAKPLVVQGANDFWRLLDESSLPGFLVTGWFGHGGKGDEDLHAGLSGLIADKELRATLGSFGREVVVSRFSLRRAVDVQLAIYEAAIVDRPDRRTIDREVRRTAFEVAKFKVYMATKHRREHLRPWLGRTRPREDALTH